MMIMHGIVKLSRCFDLEVGDMMKILGSLRHILELTVKMSPNVTSEKNAQAVGDGEDLSDNTNDEIDLDDNKYTTPPEGDEGDEDDEDDVMPNTHCK